jgi:hypothetical protein
MLYPQYEDKFAKVIPKSTWDYLQEKAKEKLADPNNEHMHADVRKHLESIRDGAVPFDFRIEGE